MRLHALKVQTKLLLMATCLSDPLISNTAKLLPAVYSPAHLGKKQPYMSPHSLSIAETILFTDM